LDPGKKTSKVIIESIEGAAIKKLNIISSQIEQRDGIFKVLIIHFTGEFNIGEPMVYVFVYGAHRKESFEAIREAITRYKNEVPIWKKEIYSDGTSKWIKH
ncbi:MAG: molybdenum cofactor biosynthesis protein MoaE, partial [Promethearchaeota archaeon]